MNKPIGLGFVEGGVFRMTGSTEEEQDELTASMTKQLSATESPISGYAMWSFEASNKNFNATAIMVVDDDSHNNG
jgi:hypothetical protein